MGLEIVFFAFLALAFLVSPLVLFVFQLINRDRLKKLERALGTTAEIDWQPNQVGDVSRTWADIAAARAAIGYAPKTDFEDGIERFIEWIKEQ